VVRPCRRLHPFQVDQMGLVVPSGLAGLLDHRGLVHLAVQEVLRDRAHQRVQDHRELVECSGLVCQHRRVGRLGQVDLEFREVRAGPVDQHHHPCLEDQGSQVGQVRLGVLVDRADQRVLLGKVCTVVA